MGFIGRFTEEVERSMAEVPAAEVPQAEKDELFCAYAGMILTDSDIDITEDNLNKLIKAAGGKVEPFYPALFAKICGSKDISKFLKFGGGGGGGGGAPVAAAGGAGAPAAAKEEKKVEEEEEEEDVDFDLSGEWISCVAAPFCLRFLVFGLSAVGYSGYGW